MKIKFSPAKWNPCAASRFQEGTLPDTEIVVTGDNSLTIDGELYEFDEGSVEWPCRDYSIEGSPPGISELTDGRVREAHRENGEMFITIRFFYTGLVPSICDNEYHEVRI